MKSYEELLSDIEEDMELMGSSHIVYSMEEDDIVTDYDYLPSDSCTISITLKELQEKLQLQMLYTKVSAHTAGADKNAPKLAVVFPGIGYTADKPLLYYTSRLASKHGYKIHTVSYGTLPENVKGDPEKMKQAFDLALEQTERSLGSIGTVISSAYASRHDLTVKSILFTPLAETFSFPLAGSIAFHGTADPWAETNSIRKLAAQKDVPLFLTQNANHSLETGDVLTDIFILKTTMERVQRFI